MTTLDSALLESVEKDYFDDPRVMALVDRFRCAQSESAAATSHVFNTEDPRCVDGANACTDCMYRGACLLNDMECEHRAALLRLKLDVLAKGPAEPFSREAISATQTAWKMGYEAGKRDANGVLDLSLPPGPVKPGQETV